MHLSLFHADALKERNEKIFFIEERSLGGVRLSLNLPQTCNSCWLCVTSIAKREWENQTSYISHPLEGWSKPRRKVLLASDWAWLKAFTHSRDYHQQTPRLRTPLSTLRITPLPLQVWPFRARIPVRCVMALGLGVISDEFVTKKQAAEESIINSVSAPLANGNQ